MGVPVEFKSREYLNRNPVSDMRGFGSHFQPAGTWSDDTSLTLCLLDGLSYSPFNITKIADNFVKWMFGGKYAPRHIVFDVGRTTRSSILKMLIANDPTTCGSDSEKSQGNGSLMRIIPLAFYLVEINDYERRKQLIYDISSLTHRHIVCKIACHFYVELAIKLIKGYAFANAYAETRIEFVKYYRNRLPEKDYAPFRRIFSGEVTESARKDIKSSGYVIHTLESALWCIGRNDCYKDVVLDAVNLGRDTDTTAAVCGALAGILFPDSIPKDWIKKLSSKRLIDKAVDKFYQSL